MSPKKPLYVVDAGRIPYAAAFDLQREIVAARKSNTIPDVLLFCEHPHVITLGRNGDLKNLLATQNVLEQMNVEFHETDRGGDITYHGPGQVVGYPILDLTQHRRDVRWYVEQLEEVMISTAADYGLAARRILCQHGIWIDPPHGSVGGGSFSSDDAVPGSTNLPIGTFARSTQLPAAKNSAGSAATKPQGTASAVPSDGNMFGALAPEDDQPYEENLSYQAHTSAGGAADISPARKGWVNDQKRSSARGAAQTSAATEEKLAALGVHLSRWVTSHGFAFNVSTDLRFFDLIIPCGIHDKRATSLERALGRRVSIDEARNHLARHFSEIFACEIHRISLDELKRAISPDFQPATSNRS